MTDIREVNQHRRETLDSLQAIIHKLSVFERDDAIGVRRRKTSRDKIRRSDALLRALLDKARQRFRVA